MTPRVCLAAAALLIAGCASEPKVRKASSQLGEPKACEALLERPADTSVSAASAPTGEDAVKARGAVEAQAFTALQQRLCRGWRCDELAEGIRVVDFKEHEGNSCAQAGVSASFLAGWLKPAQEELEAALAADAKRMAGVFDSSGMLDSANPQVVIPAVVDMGVEGGQRARWLREQAVVAFKAAGLEVMPAPAGWYGRGVPAGAHGVARAYVRPGRARKERFEVVWELETAAGRTQGQAREIVRALADDVPEATAKAELLTGTAGGVGAAVAAEEGGGLCAGAPSALWVDLAAPMFVRVFVVYGAEQAAQVYPRAAGDAGRLEAGPRELVKFTAGELGGAGAARFLVVASPDEAGLGRMKTLDRACALPADSARKLHAGGGVAPTAIETTRGAGFRLLDAAMCEGAPASPATGLEWVNDLPTCWEK
jgi:outer membrane murein-binding lipoprotein Lpp